MHFQGSCANGKELGKEHLAPLIGLHGNSPGGRTHPRLEVGSHGRILANDCDEGRALEFCIRHALQTRRGAHGCGTKCLANGVERESCLLLCDHRDSPRCLTDVDRPTYTELPAHAMESYLFYKLGGYVTLRNTTRDKRCGWSD
jgi:hypothetical protein